MGRGTGELPESRRPFSGHIRATNSTQRPATMRTRIRPLAAETGFPRLPTAALADAFKVAARVRIPLEAQKTKQQVRAWFEPPGFLSGRALHSLRMVDAPHFHHLGPELGGNPLDFVVELSLKRPDAGGRGFCGPGIWGGCRAEAPAALQDAI